MVKPEKVSKTGAIRARNILKIIDAAEHEFVQYGYKGTSMQSIADKAELPKANILYYFKSKEKLYIAVIEQTLDIWKAVFGNIREEDDPAEELERFIRAKLDMSFKHPRASKLFAMEIILGAPHIKNYIKTDMRAWVNEKIRVIERWIELGKMDVIDPMQLIFMMWSTTQHYADFDSQVLILMERNAYKTNDKEKICRCVIEIILKGCGLVPSHLKK